MGQAIMATGVVLVGLQILSIITHILHYAYFKKRLDRIEQMIPQPVTYEDMSKIEAPLILDDWRIRPMTKTNTSPSAVRIMQKRIGSTPFPDGLQGIADDASLMIASLEARAEKAEISLSQMRDAVAEIEGFSEDWPTHGNTPLAIVAGYSLHKSGREEAEAERDTAWNDAIETAASMVEADYFETACEAAEQIRALRKGEPT